MKEESAKTCLQLSIKTIIIAEELHELNGGNEEIEMVKDFVQFVHSKWRLQLEE